MCECYALELYRPLSVSVVMVQLRRKYRCKGHVSPSANFILAFNYEPYRSKRSAPFFVTRGITPSLFLCDFKAAFCGERRLL